MPLKTVSLGFARLQVDLTRLLGMLIERTGCVSAAGLPQTTTASQVKVFVARATCRGRETAEVKA